MYADHGAPERGDAASAPPTQRGAGDEAA